MIDNIRLFWKEYAVGGGLIGGVVTCLAFYNHLTGRYLGPDLLCVLKFLWKFKYRFLLLLLCLIGIVIGCFLWEFGSWFLLLLFPIGIVIGSLIKGKIFNRVNEDRIRIAILLPLSSEAEIVKQDADLILAGFGGAIGKNREMVDEIDFAFLDHKNNPAEAEKIIKCELKRRTKYFVCTMSDVCESLSTSFKELDEIHGKGDGILLCTVAASGKVKTEINKVYRFYIHLENEVTILFGKILRAPEKKKAAIIYFDSTYSETSAKMFKGLWVATEGCTCAEIELLKDNVARISSRLIEHRNDLQYIDVIYMVSYGNVYKEILEAIGKINTTATIVTASTCSFKLWPSEIISPLKKYDWITCRPKLRSGEKFREDMDVVEYFALNSLDRIIYVISKIKSKKNRDSFDELWKRCPHPRKLDYSSGNNGDTIVELKAIMQDKSP